MIRNDRSARVDISFSEAISQSLSLIEITISLNWVAFDDWNRLEGVDGGRTILLDRPIR